MFAAVFCRCHVAVIEVVAVVLFGDFAFVVATAVVVTAIANVVVD